MIYMQKSKYMYDLMKLTVKFLKNVINSISDLMNCLALNMFI